MSLLGLYSDKKDGNERINYGKLSLWSGACSIVIKKVPNREKLWGNYHCGVMHAI